MDSSMSPTPSLHPVSPCEIKREKVTSLKWPLELELVKWFNSQTEASSPSDCCDSNGAGMIGGGSGGGGGGICAACGELITDRFLIQVSGRTWHSTCLRCSVCCTVLDTQPSCFVRAGVVYCRNDYTRYLVFFSSMFEIITTIQ